MYDGYRAVLAEQVALSPAEWTFKAHPVYRAILEHVSPEQGHAYIAVMQADFPAQWKLYKQVLIETALRNDTLGSPEKAAFPEIGLFCSPTNLRYMHQALSVEAHMREHCIGQVHAIEIGGGYGGLALFLRRAFPWRWLGYTIVDLPEPGAIQRAYAEALGFPIRTVDGSDLSAIATAVNARPHNERFLISAYGFSEFSPTIRTSYEDMVIQHVPHGWMVWNMIPVYQFTRATIAVSPERPETGRGNRIVRF